MSDDTPTKSEGEFLRAPFESQSKSFKGILQTSSKKEKQRKISWGDVRVRYFPR